MTDARPVPRALRREWITVLAATVLLVFGGASALSIGLRAAAVTFEVARLAVPAVAVRWLVPTVAVAGFELWFCRRHLDGNHPTEGDEGQVAVFSSLGAPNLVTLGRGALFAGLAGFGAVAPRPEFVWAPAALYGLGCALDFVDGFLARRTGRTTVLGSKLDMAIDTTGFLVAPVVAVLWGRLPVWYLSLSAARYAFRLGRWLRRRRGKPVYELPASVVRRPLAGIQMAFITLALAPILSTAVLYPLAAVVLVPSLAVFARDYLVVAGWR